MTDSYFISDKITSLENRITALENSSSDDDDDNSGDTTNSGNNDNMPAEGTVTP